MARKYLGVISNYRFDSVSILAADILGKFPPENSVHVLLLGDDSHPSKIYSVGIPAGTDCGIMMVGGFRVPGACRLQQIELHISDPEMDFAKLSGICRTSSAMIGV